MVDIDQAAVHAVSSHMLQAEGGDGLRDRTPADYAIEHAGYLVTAANQLIEARDELDGLALREEECGDVEDEEVEAAEDSVRDATSCLRLAIYEFEKRRDRAFAARQTVGQEPVAWLIYWSDMPEASPELARSAPRIAEVSALADPPRIVPLYTAPPAQAVGLPYSLDADPAGIRARVCDVITGTLMVGAQGHTPPPAGHWAEPFWKAARDDAAAQAVELGQMPQGIRLIEIPRRNNLDPINVFVQDYGLGRGCIVVTCYGQAWCGFWGAMGDRTVMQFVAACDADYVAGNMLSGRHERVLKRERDYVERIAIEVIAEFRALIDSQAVRNG